MLDKRSQKLYLYFCLILLPKILFLCMTATITSVVPSFFSLVFHWKVFSLKISVIFNFAQFSAFIIKPAPLALAGRVGPKSKQGFLDSFSVWVSGRPSKRAEFFLSFWLFSLNVQLFLFYFWFFPFFTKFFEKQKKNGDVEEIKHECCSEMF